MAAELDVDWSILDEVPKKLLIGGAWIGAEGGRTLSVDDPATGRMLCEVADASPDDATRALSAAADVQASWAARPPRERGEILRAAWETVTRRSDELALLITLEMGKPLAEARAEVRYGAEFLRWFSEEAVRIEGRFTKAPDGDGRLLTMRQPVGPCVLITPWNFPLAMATRKIAPALAAGCTAVVKPAALTPLSTLMFGRILQDAGLPAGVVNIVTTSSAEDVVSRLLRDPRTRKMSFTGSTEVGRQLIAQSADQVLRVSMELGGNAPFLVFDDADLDAAVEGALLAKLRNMGEACTAANRFYVSAPVADEFTARLADRMGRLRVGRGTDAGVDIGPLVSRAQRDKVAALVDDAVARGATVAAGAEAMDGPGWFYRPTVLTDVPSSARLLDEEIFGPVAPVVPVGDDEEAIALANATEYGLAAYVYTRDIGRALRTVERLDVGMVGLNRGIVSNAAAPFGGIKQSGFGREGGPGGIDEYLETKYVALEV